jgi:hypothetical protein
MNKLRDILPASPRQRKFPALHLDRVHVRQVGHINLARAQALGRQFARIGSAAGVRDLIAATVRERKGCVALPNRGEFGRHFASTIRHRPARSRRPWRRRWARTGRQSLLQEDANVPIADKRQFVADADGSSLGY